MNNIATATLAEAKYLPDVLYEASLEPGSSRGFLSLQDLLGDPIYLDLQDASDPPPRQQPQLN